MREAGGRRARVVRGAHPLLRHGRKRSSASKSTAPVTSGVGSGGSGGGSSGQPASGPVATVTMGARAGAGTGAGAARARARQTVKPCLRPGRAAARATGAAGARSTVLGARTARSAAAGRADIGRWCIRKKNNCVAALTLSSSYRDDAWHRGHREARVAAAKKLQARSKICKCKAIIRPLGHLRSRLRRSRPHIPLLNTMAAGAPTTARARVVVGRTHRFRPSLHRLHCAYRSRPRA